MPQARHVERQPLYTWKSKYGGMDVSDAKILKSLEEENDKLKKLELCAKVGDGVNG